MNKITDQRSVRVDTLIDALQEYDDDLKVMIIRDFDRECEISDVRLSEFGKIVFIEVA